MAYAAVVSLKQTIDRLHHPSKSILFLPNSDLKSIYDEVCYLQSFLESIGSFRSSNTTDAWESQIKDAAHKAEDVIESHMSDLLLSESENSNLTLEFSEELLQVKFELISLAGEMKNRGECETEDEKPPDSSASDVAAEVQMVGLDDEVLKLKHWLFGGSKRLDVISVVGMAGIGKSTLARKVYDDETAAVTFPHRCCLTIGPKYELRQFVKTVLDQMDLQINEMHKKGDGELKRELHKLLNGRRYLIMLDDIWDIKVWDELRHIFPNDNKRSRILLTSRLVNVGRYASFTRHVLQMPFLNDDESWNLLHQVVFTREGESCSPELEKIGKQIAKNCEGLPLAIVAFGNLLSSTEKSVEKWQSIAEKDNSLGIGSDDYSTISRVLSLSYKQLPQHLKACFLYFGVFSHNYEIPASRLVKLWVSEGFFEAKDGQSSEETAEECLDDLVSRSLVLVREWSSRGRTKTCRIHFVFRNLCVSEARNEKFFHVLKDANGFPEGGDSQRRLSIHNNIVPGLGEVYESMESVSKARSLLFFGRKHHHWLQVYLSYKLLRVLDTLAIRFYKFPSEVLTLVQLRYLAITIDRNLPEDISKLWALEVLIVSLYQRIKSSDAPVYLPVGVWELCGLRHLQCVGFDLPDPSPAGAEGNGGDSLILEKLLTLSGVSAPSCMESVLGRMPNLRKIGVLIEPKEGVAETYTLFGDFSNLHRLESFKCIVVHPDPTSQGVPSIPTFFENLRKITLGGCGYSWEDMTYIGELRNLEVLKLRCNAFQGPDWELVAGEFRRLKFLLLEDLDIEHWRGNSYHLPLLTCLIIRHCYNLEEIPHEFGDIPALRVIEVDDCNPSVVNSARKIEKAQQKLGNQDPQVRIICSWDDQKKLKSQLQAPLM